MLSRSYLNSLASPRKMLAHTGLGYPEEMSPKGLEHFLGWCSGSSCERAEPLVKPGLVPGGGRNASRGPSSLSRQVWGLFEVRASGEGKVGAESKELSAQVLYFR